AGVGGVVHLFVAAGPTPPHLHPANNGLFGGDVRCLAFTPATTTLYAGTPGGVYASTDDGGTCVLRRSGIPDDDAIIRTIAVDPATPTTVYAGSIVRGLFKSTDGGGRWNRVLTFTKKGILAIAIAPTNPNLIFVSALSGLSRSTDGGSTWS